MKKLISLLGLILSFGAHSYTIDEYIKTLDQYDVNTVGEGVSYLPNNILSTFALMYQGHGLRGTSYQGPGVIAFDSKGTFFANFGSPDKAMGNEIEILQFNKSTSKFELYALSFPLKRNADGKIVRPEANPARCLSCHGTDPVLLWGEYQIGWGGAYGSGLFDGLAKNELAPFKKFRETTAKTSPYQYLNFDSKNDLSPYQADAEKNFLKMANRPNSHLNFLATRLNALVLTRQIKASPQFYNLRYPLLNELLCENITPFKDKKILKKLNITLTDKAPVKDGAFKVLYSILGHNLMKLLASEYNDKEIEQLLSPTTMRKTFVEFYEDPKHYSRFTLPSMEDKAIFDDIDSLGVYQYTQGASYREDNVELCKFLATKK